MKSVLLSTLLCLISVIIFGQDLNTDMEQLTYLKTVEWPKAYREQDTVLLDKILATEFQMIDTEGNWYTKKDELTYIKSNKPSYKSFKYEIKRLEIFENETAIISGIGYIQNADKEGEFLMTYHSSNVLIKRKNTWKAISSHVSGIKKAYTEVKE